MKVKIKQRHQDKMYSLMYFQAPALLILGEKCNMDCGPLNIFLN